VGPQIDKRIFVHQIDSKDRIIFVNEAWLSFARENNAPDLSLDSVMNKPLWYFITDFETHHLYKTIIARTRTTGTSIRIPFRCDSPDCRRFMELEISSASGGVVEFKGRVLKQESRDPIDFFDRSTERSREMATMCSICKKVKVHGRRWYEVGEAIDVFHLFGPPKPPSISHGLCPGCAKSARQLICMKYCVMGESSHPLLCLRLSVLCASFDISTGLPDSILLGSLPAVSSSIFPLT
jgi:hypothetical protein